MADSFAIPDASPELALPLDGVTLPEPIRISEPVHTPREDPRATLALELMLEGVVFIDRRFVVRYWNHGAERATGFERRRVEGRTLEMAGIVFADSSARILNDRLNPLDGALAVPRREDLRLFVRHFEGYWVPITLSATHAPAGAGYVVTFRDETPAPIRDFGETQAAGKPLLDSATGLVSQDFLEQRIAEEIARIRFSVGSAALIGWQMDQFDAIGSRYGEDFQREATRIIGRSLANALRPADILASAGDKGMIFALLRNCTAENGKSAAERCRILVASTRVRALDREVWITVSTAVTDLRARDSAEATVDRVVWRLRDQDPKERNLLLEC